VQTKAYLKLRQNIFAVYCRKVFIVFDNTQYCVICDDIKESQATEAVTLLYVGFLGKPYVGAWGQSSQPPSAKLEAV